MTKVEGLGGGRGGGGTQCRSVVKERTHGVGGPLKPLDSLFPAPSPEHRFRVVKILLRPIIVFGVNGGGGGWGGVFFFKCLDLILLIRPRLHTRCPVSLFQIF